MSKSIIFPVKSLLGNFYRHLATFYWSHCRAPLSRAGEEGEEGWGEKSHHQFTPHLFNSCARQLLTIGGVTSKKRSTSVGNVNNGQIQFRGKSSSPVAHFEKRLTLAEQQLWRTLAVSLVIFDSSNLPKRL